MQPLPSSTETSAPAPATFTSVPEAPAAPMVQWQPGQSVEVLPAWARGAESDAGASAAAAEPEPAAYYAVEPGDHRDLRAGPAEPSASILPFKPQPDTWMHRAPQQAEAAAEAESRAVPPGPTVAPRRSFRVNWARTLAASLLVALLEGVAFATAWWYVTPEQQGWLVVHTKPAGIQIAVDGLVLGKTPFAKALAPGRHTIELRYGTGTRVVPVEISAGVQTEQRLTWGNGFTSGQASISSTPAGSKVSIDGRLMGKTPLTVSDLLPGKHEVTVEGEKGSVSTMLMVEAGQTTELDVPVYAGWASVLSPVQLDILLDGKLVGSTEIEKLMLKPGKHNARARERVARLPRLRRGPRAARGDDVGVGGAEDAGDRRSARRDRAVDQRREHGHAAERRAAGPARDGGVRDALQGRRAPAGGAGDDVRARDGEVRARHRRRARPQPDRPVPTRSRWLPMVLPMVLREHLENDAESA